MITPPSRLPAAPPPAATAPHTPSALLRSAPSANVVVTRLSAAGERIAAPRPCSARAAISVPPLVASPPANDATANSAKPAHEHPPAPEQVRHPPAEQQEAAERQHVRVHQPRETLLGEVEIPPDRRQRDVDHGRVEHDDELRGGEQRERPPLACWALLDPMQGILELRQAPYIGRRAHCPPEPPLWPLRGGGEPLTPGRVLRRPAQLGLGLGVRRAAGLGHHRHRGRAGDELRQPRRDLARRLRAELLGEEREPLLGRRGLVVDDVVDLARAAVLDRRQRRRGEVVGVQEGPDRPRRCRRAGTGACGSSATCSPSGAIPVPGP